MARRYAWVVYDRSITGPSQDLRRIVQVATTSQINDKEPALEAPPSPGPGLIVQEVDSIHTDKLHELMQMRELYWNVALSEWQRDVRWEG